MGVNDRNKLGRMACCALWSITSSLLLLQLSRDLSDYLSPLPFFYYELYCPSFLCDSSHWSGIITWLTLLPPATHTHTPAFSLTSSLPIFYLFFPLMIKWFNAQGGSSIVPLKDRIINTSELHLQREESTWQVAKSSYCDINNQWKSKLSWQKTPIAIILL